MIPQIAAQGTAEVRAAPDRAVVRFGVQFDAPEAQAAQRRVSEATRGVIQGLRSLNIPESCIATDHLYLLPVYDKKGQTRVVGYRASNLVRVELNDLAHVGPVIDAAVGAGANEVEGIQFAVADEAPFRAQALRQASEEARAKAQAIALSLGVQLGDLIEASEGATEVAWPGVPARRPVAAMTFAPTPVEPGEMTIRATVTIRYSIAGQ